MNWIIAALAVGLALAIGAVALSQNTRTANVEVRVWQKVDDDRALYISARPEGGSWATLGTTPLPLDDGHSSNGRFRYGDITVAVPVASAMKDVEVRVWQDVNNARNIYVSARPDGGSWRTLGTIPIPLTDGVSGSGNFRYGDITLAVEMEDAVEPEATPSPTATPTPTPGPTYGSCSAAYAAGLTGHWNEEEARALGLPLERSDSDGDGIYCERRSRATMTPTPTPSPTPVPTARPTPVPTSAPVVVTTPVPSYSQPQPSGGGAAPRSTPTATPTRGSGQDPDLAAAELALIQTQLPQMAALNARWSALEAEMSQRLREGEAALKLGASAVVSCIYAFDVGHERCLALARSVDRMGRVNEETRGLLSQIRRGWIAEREALAARFLQELAALRAQYQ